MAFASAEIINVLNKVKPPYNINSMTQKLVLESIGNILKKEKMVMQILEEREYLSKELTNLSYCVVKIYPSDANFILAKTLDGNKIYNYLVEKKIITRNRSNVTLCEGCIRISVGTAEENRRLIEALKEYK